MCAFATRNDAPRLRTAKRYPTDDDAEEQEELNWHLPPNEAISRDSRQSKLGASRYAIAG
jgi:hypothetical protein